jgi:glycosyltransferase involved in cell wall biosynthesis
VATVLLIHKVEVQHYRVPVYNYLTECLKKAGFELTVVSERLEPDTPHLVEFDFIPTPLRLWPLAKLVWKKRPDAIILFVGINSLYLFPLMLIARLLSVRTLYWGHGRDLMRPNAFFKNLAYTFQHWLCDAIILYGEHLRALVSPRQRHKVFVANNTLNITEKAEIDETAKPHILKRYNIHTSKNIICIGRMERRKRIDDLFRAFRLLDGREYGLVLVGPDLDGSTNNIGGSNVYKLGAIYGRERLELLQAMDVCCLPGHVGLSIVDAFHCGLPMVTEDVRHAPEIMYLKHGVNGFIVPQGDIEQLAAKLDLLLEDDRLRRRFSIAARKEIATAGSMDTMCKGFVEALAFTCRVRLSQTTTSEARVDSSSR